LIAIGRLAADRPDFKATGSGAQFPFGWLNKNCKWSHQFFTRWPCPKPDAVLWHGGEAEQSKQRVKEMRQAERNALIKFLKSL